MYVSNIISLFFDCDDLINIHEGKEIPRDKIVILRDYRKYIAHAYKKDFRIDNRKIINHKFANIKIY
ncbi:MAG: hypothetical protein KatS3mg002_1342 [Candidatus Woesearchaeota archaeon]|nr:MAG: hypothetical protein KatS3mg002_1342 [Candidatus Woesearchaeota archaeon]